MRYLNKIIEYGTLAFVFLIPWQARWIIKTGQLNGGDWEYGTNSPYATQGLLLTVLLAVIGKGLVYLKREKPKFNVKNLQSPGGAVLLILFWVGLSILWSINREVAWERFAVLTEAAAIFLILISGIISWKKLSWVIIVSAATQALAGLAQFVSQSIPASTLLGMATQLPETLGASVVEGAYGRWLRAYGSFPHPNILAGWLVLSLILIVIIASEAKQSIFKFKVQSSKLQEVSLVSFFVVILFGLLATFSRTAWLAFFLFSIFYFLYSLVQKKGRDLAVAIIGLIAVCVFAFAVHAPEPFLARLAGEGRLEAKSNMERASSINQSWQIINQSPILGVGIGNYGLAVFEQIDSSRPAWSYQPAHNVFLLILAELGLIGFLLFTFYFLLFLKKQKKKILATTIFLSPLLIMSFFDHYLWSLYPGLLMGAVYLGLAFSWLRPKGDE